MPGFPRGRMGGNCHQALLHQALLLTLMARGALSDMAGTYTMTEVLGWQRKSQMQLLLMAPELDFDPLALTVIPLTTNLGLNESQLTRGRVNIQGTVIAADATNYANISGPGAIPYLSCDASNTSFLEPSAILNALMSKSPQPAAIILYSVQGMCCGLTGQDLNFNAILTMIDGETASQTLMVANMSVGPVRAQISGNFTGNANSGGKHGNNSTVAMSILYSITGLITLLFLVIIATGAIRAHRYPERYGPRSGHGGMPRQSRAKGLARAVLETLPIIKFGDSQPKLDPNLELESTTSHRRDASRADQVPPVAGGTHHLSTIPENPLSPAQPASSGALSPGPDSKAEAPGASGDAQESSSNPRDGPHKPGDGSQAEEALSCSICTDDFTVGEDVRVLPCDHKFHPACVDPWLVNVSGTCPLCRLDLRPGRGKRSSRGSTGRGHGDGAGQGHGDGAGAGQGGHGGNDDHEVPPLSADPSYDTTEAPSSSRRRSRLFDLHRLRHAPLEERIEVLRRYRTERPVSTASSEDDARARTGLTDRLRDRFRIRTRPVRPAPAPAPAPRPADR